MPAAIQSMSSASEDGQSCSLLAPHSPRCSRRKPCTMAHSVGWLGYSWRATRSNGCSSSSTTGSPIEFYGRSEPVPPENVSEVRPHIGRDRAVEIAELRVVLRDGCRGEANAQRLKRGF